MRDHSLGLFKSLIVSESSNFPYFNEIRAK